jgi:hypothetical protein
MRLGVTGMIGHICVIGNEGSYRVSQQRLWDYYSLDVEVTSNHIKGNYETSLASR